MPILPTGGGVYTVCILLKVGFCSDTDRNNHKKKKDSKKKIMYYQLSCAPPPSCEDDETIVHSTSDMVGLPAKGERRNAYTCIHVCVYAYGGGVGR